MPVNRPALAPLAVLLVAALVAGCSSDGPSTEGPPDRADVPWAEQPMTAAIVPGEIEDTLSVIDSYVSASDLTALVARRDEAAVRCLAERGLAVELDPDGAGPATAAGGDVAVTRAEFAATWGFGQVAPLGEDGGFRDEYAELSQQLHEATPPYVPMAGTLPDVALEQTAFHGPDAGRLIVELYGPDAHLGGPAPPAATGEPCRDVAAREVGLVEGSGPLAAGAALRAEARERVANDPRILDLKDAYRGCMAAQGFDGVASPTAAAMSIGEEAGRLRAEAVEVAGPGQAPDAQSVGPDLVRRFQELGAREVALATANVACAGPLMEGAVPVSEAIQQQVIDDNGALVAQLGGR